MQLETRHGPVWLAIISSGRPAHVPWMTSAVGPATWYVPLVQGDAYEAAGAPQIGATTGGLCAQRNLALFEAWSHDLPCLQMDDDLKAFKRIRGKRHADTEPVAPIAVANALYEALAAPQHDAYRLAGLPPTTNPFFADVAHPYSLDKFISARTVLVLPDTDLIFDERLTLKEDYDYTLQHLARYGGAVRCDLWIGNFAYRLAGGVQAYRTPDEEDRNIAMLKAKWPAAIRDHPTRPHEILLRWHPAPVAG